MFMLHSIFMLTYKIGRVRTRRHTKASGRTLCLEDGQTENDAFTTRQTIAALAHIAIILP